MTALAVLLPAHAASAAPTAPKNCNAYQKTVNRHQATMDDLDERHAAERAELDRLSGDLQEATGEADFYADELLDVGESLGLAEPDSPEYARLLKEREELNGKLAQARAKERAAYGPYRDFELDRELAADRAKTQRLLKTAQTRLRNCQNQLAS
ncbi:hypothetical protein DY218_23420 [Streptomyces triticagri]|uniref:Lysozyme inhibitor LprI N-terminal domain-containing protein n=1 Tax=Streptomyces triticagri TaxID=2293568 RepID=A0A372M044_9ACTN|nr:hypothetical protein DY218_23420 [Streptomyces triticagri]